MMHKVAETEGLGEKTKMEISPLLIWQTIKDRTRHHLL